MKNRSNWLVAAAAALSLAACQKKKEAVAPEAPAPVESAAKATPTPPAPDVKSQAFSPEERAAKLGFVKHLPKDTEVVIALHNGSKSAERVKSTKLWKLIQSEMGLDAMMGEPAPAPMEIAEDDFELPDAEQETAATDEDPDEVAEPSGPAALFGTEFTMAMGKSCGEQTGNLLKLNGRLGYFQMRMLAKAFVNAAKDGDFSTMEDAFEEQYGPELMIDLLKDPQSGIELFERMKMPPMYFAFHSNPEGLGSAAQQLASLVENLGMMGEVVEPVSIEKDGQTFAGQKISGKLIAESMEEDGREEMEEILEPATVDKLIAAVGKKDIVVVSGTIGDYAVLFLGSSVEDLQFAPDLASSMVSTDALAFCDNYADKELAAVVYGQKAAVDQLILGAGGLSNMADGLRDGLAGSDGLGDTRDLEALLRMVAERESALRKLSSNEAAGMVAFFEDGLKLESFGGSDNGMINWNSPNKLASLGDSKDVVLFANMTADATYDEKSREFLEALMETAYAITTKVAEIPIDNSDMDQFKEMTKVFDTKFRGDLLAMWETFSSDFGSSLGHESALIVDLSGTVPAIPGIPQAVVDEAKFPRISMISPVTDRAKLATSWQKMNAGATNILANISEMVGEDIPMQKPISSDKDGYTTWFFSMPFFNDDFMPSVTVGDQWFAASTSKNQALDLISKAEAATETRNGFYMAVNFQALQTFSGETLEVMKRNSEAIFGDGGMSDNDWEDAAKVISTMDDLDRFTVHSRKDGGKLRTSIHLKTR